MPLPPALAKKLATRGILSENEGKCETFSVLGHVLKTKKQNFGIKLYSIHTRINLFILICKFIKF